MLNVSAKNKCPGTFEAGRHWFYLHVIIGLFHQFKSFLSPVLLHVWPSLPQPPFWCPTLNTNAAILFTPVDLLESRRGEGGGFVGFFLVSLINFLYPGTNISYLHHYSPLYGWNIEDTSNNIVHQSINQSVSLNEQKWICFWVFCFR